MLGPDVLSFDRGVFQAGSGDDIDDPGDGVRAIDRGRAVTQDFDMVDHRVRQDVEVGGPDAAARAGRSDPPAVDHHQGATCAETPQRKRLSAGAAVGDESAIGAVDLRGAAGDRRALQKVSRGRIATDGHFLTRDHLDRRGRIEDIAVNARAHNHDLFERRVGCRLGLLRCRRRCLRRRTHRKGETQHQDDRRAAGEILLLTRIQGQVPNVEFVATVTIAVCGYSRSASKCLFSSQMRHFRRTSVAIGEGRTLAS